MTTKKEKISGGVPKNPVMKYLYLNKGILAGALGIFLVFGFLTEFKFWGRANVINILRITSLDSIAAFGVTLIIITGGIDLSVGALMACASTYCALLISNGLHPAGALLVGVLIATVFGAINGGIVANTKIPPFIVTLGTMNIGRGIAYTCSAGTPIRISGDFGEIGNGYLMNTIPYPIIYTAVILAITYVLLNKTKLAVKYMQSAEMQKLPDSQESTAKKLSGSYIHLLDFCMVSMVLSPVPDCTVDSRHLDRDQSLLQLQLQL